MIQLLVVACLLAHPNRCETHQLPTERMGLMECMVTSQQFLVRWTADHPNWRIRRWSCGFPRA